MTEITPFEFPITGQQVRTIRIDSEPRFVLTDVAKILGYRDAEHASRLVRAGQLGTLPEGTWRDLGGRGSAPTIVTEGGLYRLVMRSDVAMAEQFQDWVTDEVLPAIRRTGSYSAAPQFEIPQTYAEALRLAADQAEQITEQRRRLAVTAPKAQAWDTLASAAPDYSVREAAYILNRDPSIDTGQNRLFEVLRRMRVVDSRDIPYSSHARHVKLRARSFTNRATGDEQPAKPQVRITAEGLAYLHKRLGGTAPLRLDEQLAIEGG